MIFSPKRSKYVLEVREIRNSSVGLNEQTLNDFFEDILRTNI
jgi:hypothetical protein